MLLKPQDTLLALKYWVLRQAGQQMAVRELAESVGISASEVSKSAKRLVSASLLVERESLLYPEANALYEWLAFGVRYAYPVQQMGYGRGMACAWNCPLIISDIVPPSPPFVWAAAGGKTEGVQIAPLHDSVPLAASKDKSLYHILALVEAIRLGKPRELAIARPLLKQLLEGS